MLGLDIAEKWDVPDFSEVLQAIESMYYKAVLVDYSLVQLPLYWTQNPILVSYDTFLKYSNEWLLDQARTTVPYDSRLSVLRIDYASPGKMDFFGVGDACKALEGVIDRLIKFFTERHIRKERDKQAALKTKVEEFKVEKEEQSLIALKLKNADTLLKLRRKYPEIPLPDNFLVELFIRDQDRLVPRIAEGKLIAVTSSERTIVRSSAAT